MSDINFLPGGDKSGEDHKKDKKKNKKQVEWSRPLQEKRAEDIKKSSGLFSFFKKISGGKGANKKLKKKRFDKSKLKRSREEVLELIEGYAKEQDSKKEPLESNKEKGAGVSSWFNKFKKIKESKQVDKPKETKHDFKNEEKAMPKEEVEDDLIKEPEDNQKKLETDEKPAPSSGSAPIKAAADEEKKWETPDILDTNLIKGEITFFFDWRKGIIRLSVAIILACLAIGLVYGGLIFQQRQKELESEATALKFENLNREIRQAEEGIDEILVFQNKLKLVEALLDNHIYWTNFFKFLEDHILVASYLNGGFSGNTSGNYNFSITGINYNTIYQQVKTLKGSDQVISAKVTSGNFSPADIGGQSRVNFNLELSIKPEVFYK